MKVKSGLIHTNILYRAKRDDLDSFALLKAMYMPARSRSCPEEQSGPTLKRKWGTAENSGHQEDSQGWGQV